MALRWFRPRGQRIACMLSLITTAKLNDIHPQAWIADVLARIADIAQILENEEKFQDRLKTRLLMVENVDNGTTLD
jgi:hypothetical protein